MMWRRAVAVAVVAFAVGASPAAAWDPEEDGWDWWWPPAPAPEPVASWTPPEPVASWTPPEPASSWTPLDPPAPAAPDPAPAWSAPDPAPVEAPAGIYYVTQTYVADVVTTQGPVTTYSTATVAESTGTYARVLESVGTGATSGYDGSAFNGRAQLSDGRNVAGTYYENFVLTSAGFASVSVVFFQDDSETAVSAAPPISAPPSAPPPSAPPIAIPSPLPGIVAASPPAPAIVAEPFAGAVPPAGTPTIVLPVPGTPAGPAERSGPGASGPAASGGGSLPATPPVVVPASPAHQPVLRGGVSPLPQGDLLSSIEVLRGRRIALWPRATADGAPAPIREWHALGELVALGPLSGSGDEPLVARWDRLAPPDGGWPVRLALVVDLPGGGTYPLDLLVTVIVRAPALVP